MGTKVINHDGIHRVLLRRLRHQEHHQAKGCDPLPRMWLPDSLQDANQAHDPAGGQIGSNAAWTRALERTVTFESKYASSPPQYFPHKLCTFQSSLRLDCPGKRRNKHQSNIDIHVVQPQPSGKCADGLHPLSLNASVPRDQEFLALLRPGLRCCVAPFLLYRFAREELLRYRFEYTGICE